MTIDVPTSVLLPLAGGALIAVTGYVVRAMVLDRIKALEASRDKHGERLGTHDKWIEAYEKVEEFKHRRKLTAPRGVPVQEDETP